MKIVYDYIKHNLHLALRQRKENMKKANINSKKGFTIIEVVLVLAIAGLIFLMVFVALPNLQRTQRDTQRRDDVSKVFTQVNQYLTNNSTLPTNGNDFRAKYLLDGDGEFVDPDGEDYGVEVKTQADLTAIPDNFDRTIYIVTGGKCGVDGAIEAASGKRKYAVGMRLEGAGFYCSDNN